MSEVTVQMQAPATEEIIITARAAQEIRTIKSDNKIPETHALPLGMKGGGCSGLSYVQALVYVLVVGAAMGMPMTIPPRAAAAAAALGGPDAAMDVGSGFKATVQSQGTRSISR